MKILNTRFERFQHPFELGLGIGIALASHFQINAEIDDGVLDLLELFYSRLAGRTLAQNTAGFVAIVPEIGILASIVEFGELELQAREVKDAARGARRAPVGRSFGLVLRLVPSNVHNSIGGSGGQEAAVSNSYGDQKKQSGDRQVNEPIAVFSVDRAG
jgi:hypothetical protein